MNYNFIEDVEPSLWEKVAFVLILVAFIANMSIPRAVQAAPLIKPDLSEKKFALNSYKKLDKISERFVDFDHITQNTPKEYEVVRTMHVVATAYSSTVDQCDSTPCITADGFNVCKHGKEDVIAANFLRLGTKVKLPELFGDRIFTVHDRMNPRYNYRIDIWMTDRNKALSFGKRYVKIEVVE